MAEANRFVALAPKEEVTLISSETMQEVMEELANLRGHGQQEFDSDSIDNAIRLCEKLDLCFEQLAPEARLILLQNYEFFSSGYQLTIFLKLMFHGNLTAKEATFRALFRKLKASQAVVDCILATQSLFESEALAEQVRHRLYSLIDSLVQGFMRLIPPLLHPKDQPPSTRWLEAALVEHQPILNETQMPYCEIVRDFTDLLYDIFSHEQLPFYFEWKDRYLRYWLLDVLREEDRFAGSSVPALSTLKAELYSEYTNWTKISKRLNAGLRHRHSFETENTRKAEASLLERLPSDILGQIVLKIRQQMKRKKVTEVDLGMQDHFVDEKAVYHGIVEEVLEHKQSLASLGHWFQGIVEQLKGFFKPEVTVEEASENGTQARFVERRYPGQPWIPVKTNHMYFSQHFPKHYSAHTPRYFTLFFSEYRKNWVDEFEETIREILTFYGEKFPESLGQTPRALKLLDTQEKISFEERYLAFSLEGNHLLAVGQAFFAMKSGEYEAHPHPFGYFQWWERVVRPPKESVFCKMGSNIYRLIPLDQLGPHKNLVQQALIRLMDSLPDELRSKPAVQKLLMFLSPAP